MMHPYGGYGHRGYYGNQGPQQYGNQGYNRPPPPPPGPGPSQYNNGYGAPPPPGP
ncbi:hypothetical protein JKG47_15750 [Acidithiobacillus sp. MC6.1]|nr:hypothetical protein [Acidithiobacillus sp. MC6.1]